VNGSSGNTITFTYTAATGGIAGGAITIVVPTGWNAPSLAGANPGFVKTGKGVVSVSGQTITISNLTLAGGTSFDVIYGSKAAGGPGATASTTPGAETWQAQSKATVGGTLTNLASSPSITISAPLAPDGSGTLTTPTSTVVHSSSGNTITFTYTAATGGIAGGAITIVVPTGWNAPSLAGANPGFVKTGKGVVSVSGQTITISNLTLAGGQSFQITYGAKSGGGPGATAPVSTGSQTWQAQSKATAGGTLINLAASPAISIS
jgi:hypothetical protein